MGSVSPSAQAIMGILGNADRQEYDMVAATTPWSMAPGTHFRVFLDFYNTFDYYDSEPNGDPRFSDHTTLSDTIRPVGTILWEKYRFQAGMIAQRTFGDNPDFSSIEPWLQALWKPKKNLTAVVGNLSIPHQYTSPVFYAQRYFLVEGQNAEKGLQLLHDRPGWTDDLFFNYRQLENANRQEKFDFGYVHHNDWDLPSNSYLHFTFQLHWIHTGGDNFPHPINTTNDLAEAFGGGIKKQFGDSWILGGNFLYLHSHFRADSDMPALSQVVNGNGRYWQFFFRYKRLKMMGGFWHGHNYSHESGDEYFRTEKMEVAVAHYDILLSPDFNLFSEATGYFIGNNNLGYSHYVKPTFTLQAAWHFGVPSKGWNIGAEPSSNDAETFNRWDTGL